MIRVKIETLEELNTLITYMGYISEEMIRYLRSILKIQGTLKISLTKSKITGKFILSSDSTYNLITFEDFLILIGVKEEEY